MSNSTDSAVSYETTAIIAGSLKESEKKALLERLKKEFEKIGKIVNSATWENRALAYQIGKEKTGTYAIFTFTAQPNKLPEFENMLRLDAAVIRHLTIKTPKDYKWREYTAEDLEADYTKINRNLFEEEEEQKAQSAKKPVAKKSFVKMAAAAEDAAIKAKEKPAAHKAASKKEIDSKLDDIINEL